MSTPAIEREVEWGEGGEERIVRRWAELSLFGAGAARIIKSAAYQDFDYLVLEKRGLVLVYLEVKRRRTPLGHYGDAIFPFRKHTFAEAVAGQNVPFIAVTEYGDGALVEVDLRDKPLEVRNIKRRDRPAMKPVKHAIYGATQLRVLDPGEGGP